MATNWYRLPDGSVAGFGDGATPPNGSIQLDGPPAHGLDRYDTQTGELIPFVYTPPLIDRLNEIFAGQPVGLRAQFGPLRAAVKTALDYNDTEAAYAVIEGATIPQELEPIRAALLAEFS